MQAVNPKTGGRNRRDKAVDKYWDAVNAIVDEDIKNAVKTGMHVRIIEDSDDPKIEIPTYPEFENRKRKLIDDAFENY